MIKKNILNQQNFENWNSIKTILFDLDGTLIDSTKAYYQIFDETCKRLNLTTPDYKTTVIASNTGKDIFELFLSKDQLKDKDYWKKEFATISADLWKDIFPKEATCIPGIEKTLTQLKSLGYQFGIVTSSSTNALVPLEEKNLLPLFDVIITSSDVKRKKPDPEPILSALQKLQAPREKAVIVGDTPLDILAGRAANIKTIGVQTGHHTESLLLETPPDHLLPDINYLPDFFTQARMKE
jgi:HAD superfamily hydrolase (TIGR01509 family)